MKHLRIKYNSDFEIQQRTYYSCHYDDLKLIIRSIVRELDENASSL